MRNISLCMIVKDEEKFLRNCLESVKDVVDEIIIVDTGSTDNTKKIAEEFNAKIFDYVWNDDFASARNYGIDQATGYWILIMDADERIHPDDGYAIRDLAKDGYCEAYSFYVIDSEVVGSDFTSIRMFRNKADYRYTGRIHEIMRIPVESEKDESYGLIDIRLIHYGYEDAAVLIKANRNFELLIKEAEERPNDPRVNYYLGVEYDLKHDMDKALAYYRKSFEQDEEERIIPLVISRLAMLLEHQKKYSEALACLEQGINRFEDYADLHYIKGVILIRLNEVDRAIASFNKSLEISPQPPRYTQIENIGANFAKRDLASCYQMKGDLSTARDLYFEALKSNPKDATCFRNLAKLLSTHHPLELVKSELLKIVDLNDQAIQAVISELFGFAD